MQSISHNTAARERLIRFMTPGPFLSSEDAFFLPDGEKITITSGYDGKITSHICRYLDPCHFQVSGHTFHMDQFSEVMGRNGSTYAPEKPITDLSLFNSIYCDRSLIDEQGKLIPYHEIIFQSDPDHHDRYLLRLAVCPDADALRTACISFRKSSGDHEKEFLSLQKLMQRLDADLYGSLNSWDRQSLDAVLTHLGQRQLKAGLESQINDATHQTKSTVKHSGLPQLEASR